IYIGYFISNDFFTSYTFLVYYFFAFVQVRIFFFDSFIRNFLCLFLFLYFCYLCTNPNYFINWFNCNFLSNSLTTYFFTFKISYFISNDLFTSYTFLIYYFFAFIQVRIFFFDSFIRYLFCLYFLSYFLKA